MTKSVGGLPASTAEQPLFDLRVRRFGTRPDREERLPEVIPVDRPLRGPVPIHLKAHFAVCVSGTLGWSLLLPLSDVFLLLNAHADRDAQAEASSTSPTRAHP